MEIELTRGSHSFGEANYHIQITAAYRRPIFGDETTRILTRDYILAAARMHKITVAAIGFGPDHCHVFTTKCKNYGPAQVAKLLKGFSSRMMRKHHRDLFWESLFGNKFWTSGYFYRTVGAVNADTVERYVRDSQREHWKAETGIQKQLLEFAANYREPPPL
jgi:putative transposase